MDLFWYVCFNCHKKFQKEMVKEAGAQTAALGMCCDTRLRLCRTPHPKAHPGLVGVTGQEACDLPLAPTLPVYLPSPREGTCFPWSMRYWICHRKEDAEVCRDNVQKLWLETVEHTQIEHKWNIAWMYKEDLSGIPSNLHNITLSCQSVIILPWQVKK